MTVLRRLLVICLAVAAGLLLVAVCAYLSAPFWIDSAAVKNEVARLVERATGHPVRVEQLQMRLFPPVGVEVSHPRFDSETLSVQARAVIIDLKVLPLLGGRVQPRLVRVSGASIAVSFKPGRSDRPLTLPDIEHQLRDGLARLAGAAPGLDVEVENSTVELRPASQAPVVLSNLQARARVSEAGIAASLECASGFWQRALIDFSLARDLSGRGRAEFVALDVAGVLARTSAQGEWIVDQAEAIGRIDWRMKGLSQVDAEFTASAPAIVLNRGDAVQAFSGIVAAGRIGMHGEAWSLDVDRLFLREPRLMLSGRLARDAQARYGVRVGGSDIDITELLSVARIMAPQAGWLARPPVTLEAGTIASVDLASEAESLAGLLDPAALHGDIALRDVDANLRSPAMHISGAGANIAFEQGIFRARNARATVGRSQLRDGEVDAEWTDGPRLRRAMALVDLDLAEVLETAGRFFTRKDVRAQLDAVEHLEGRALGRIQVMESRRGLQAAVDLGELAFTVRHRQLPLPLRLTAGRLRYVDGGLSLEQMAGAMGRSPFAGLDASLQLQSPYRFQVRQREARLALEELALALRRIPAMAPVLEELRGLTGRLDVRDAMADGTLEALSAATFSLVAQPHAVKTLVARLDTEMLLDGGEAQVSERAIVVRDVGIETLDARLRISGRTADYRPGLRAVEATIGGEVGAATLERLEKEASLPAALKLRAPLRLADMNMSWRRDGDISLKGRLNIADTTDFDANVTSAGGAVTVHALRVKDRASDASFTAQLAGNNLNANFRGKLAGETIAAVFAQPPLSLHSIEGDMAADLHLESPWITRAQGRLSGRAIVVPLASKTLTVDRADIEATGDGITVKDAILALDEDRAEFKGSVHRVDDKLILDADVRADRIALGELLDRPAASGEARPFALSDLPVGGRLALDVGRLEFPKGTIAPLVAEARIDGDLLDLRIERAALCNIDLSGTVRGRLADLQLDGSLTSRQADVEKSIACLTGGRVVLTGKLDLDARLKANGPLGELGRRLDGHFTARATEGRIEKFDTLNRVFAFMNLTEVVRGEKLQLGAKGLAFRTVDAKGRLAGAVVHLDEIVMDAPTVHIAAAGDIDYSDGKLGMDVLVAPLQTANVVLEKIPLMDRIFGNSILALPVRLSGTVQSPIVVPLGPGTVARRMTSIIANTLKLPIDAIKTVTPGTGTAPPAQ